VNITVLEVSGGTGPGGNFRAGDTVSVTFTIQLDDGTDLAMDDLDSGSILMSGPSFNYQRVLERQSDLRTLSVWNDDGSYTYTFEDPIPDVYLPPYNDTDAFGPGDGELTGQPLLSGTYTVGIEAYKYYEVEGVEGEFRDAGNAVADVLFGDATEIVPRAVVGQAQCNQCHSDLRAHGGGRRDVTYCLLCHTSGSEDVNNPDVAGGTPGASVDFRVMIHKIHNGEHLPSVLGVGTNDNGSRNYDLEPMQYQLVGHGDRIHNYSDVGFPAWPNLSNAMPRDEGYSGLGDREKGLEDTIRTGPTSCFLCHGDPDGDGPIAAPDQGDVAFSQPNRRSCGACHDDIDWTVPYSSNGSAMPPQPDDASCAFCHPPDGSSLAVMNAHLHPLDNTEISPGLNVGVTAVAEVGGVPDGTLDPGEKVSVTFTLTDDLGQPVLPSAVARLDVMIVGPTWNRNLLLSGSIPPSALTGGPEYTTNLPDAIAAEFLGVANGAQQPLYTDLTPIWTSATTTVLERTGSGDGVTTVIEGAPALSNFLEVASGANFTRLEYLVVDEGQPQAEYTQIQLVDGNRIWVSPALRNPHVAGATVLEIATATKASPADYTITDAEMGEITLVAGRFVAGHDVLVSYTTDFIVPSVYRPPFNDSPDLGETWGEWKRKDVVDGTYLLGIWGYRSVMLNLYGESNSYRAASPAETLNVLFGGATEIEPTAYLTSGETCNACHVRVLFHGSQRRDYETCILCHFAGSEDRPQYVAGNAPETTGATIDLPPMIHRVHMGEELDDPESYVLVGFGSAPYPDNFTPHTYAEVVFPSFLGGTMNCIACHGEGNTAWQEPSDRDHPTQQVFPVRTWRTTCGSCHNASSVAAHIDTQTSPDGYEACEVCHGPEEDLSVEIVHKPR